MTVPTKGIHVQSTMRYLFRRLIVNASLNFTDLTDDDEISILTAQPDPYPLHDMYNDDPHHFGGGSENMKLLYCVSGYVSGAQLGRERLINWYRTEKGHGGGETLTSSHDQLHLGGHCATVLQAYLTDDDEISILALNWLNIRYNLYALCEVNGEPWTPGSRGVKKDKKTGKSMLLGENPTRGLFLRAVKGRKLNKPNQYDLGAHCVAQLPIEVRSRISSPIRDWSSIEIQGGLNIVRYKDSTFHAIFESLPIGGGGVQSAGYDGKDKWIYRDAKEALPRLALYIAKPVFKSIDLQLPTINNDRIRKETDLTMATVPIKIPSTCAELYEAANLPFNKGNGLISKADSALVVECFTKIYPNFGHGYLHSSDHYAALKVLLEREPTFREVYDSYHSGSKNIDLARIKEGGGLRPSGWATMDATARRYAVLVHRYGITAGSQILDGKKKDPNPAATAALLAEWSSGVIDPPPPPPPPPPVEKPGLSPAAQRAEEIWSVGKPLVRLLLLNVNSTSEPDSRVDQLWRAGKPLFVLLIEAWRRSFASR